MGHTGAIVEMGVIQRISFIAIVIQRQPFRGATFVKNVWPGHCCMTNSGFAPKLYYAQAVENNENKILILKLLKYITNEGICNLK